MSINVKRTGNKSVQTTPNKTAGTKKNSQGNTPANSKATDNDSIDLTENASKLQQIEQSLGDIPIIDTGRVGAISQSIKDGEYTINNEKIADRIIKSETALRNKKKSL